MRVTGPEVTPLLVLHCCNTGPVRYFASSSQRTKNGVLYCRLDKADVIGQDIRDTDLIIKWTLLLNYSRHHCTPVNELCQMLQYVSYIFYVLLHCSVSCARTFFLSLPALCPLICSFLGKILFL